MDIDDIRKELCVYDSRHPDYPELTDALEWDEIREPGGDCACDNCFYGRTALADTLLREIDATIQLRDQKYLLQETLRMVDTAWQDPDTGAITCDDGYTPHHHIKLGLSLTEKDI
jgi:hypothetical protein